MASRPLMPWSGPRAPSRLGPDVFSSFHREIDRLFDDFFRPAEARTFADAAQSAWPSLDVDETDQAYTVTAELPGLEQKDVEVNLRDNALTISGEKREERKETERGRAYAERFYGEFRRTIPFATEIDADKVEAAFKNGVLTVTLPKSPNGRGTTRKIEIRPQ